MVVNERTREAAENVLEPSLQRDLLNHEGKWVAMTRAELIAVGDRPEEVLALARERGVANPIVYQVPRDGDSTFFF